ncbi:MAG: DNA polymerase IV [Ignavibacteriaceae bacterium]
MSSIKIEIRKIIHIDMDAFYASVEQRDNPTLRGKAIAVGGSKERGVVMTASYEARKYGIRSAMPSKIAYYKCPNIIFVKPRFDVYKSASKEVMNIFRSYTNLVEPLSLDEAYLDVTANKMNMPSATLIAKEIKQKIKNELSLTASAGISMNKFLAKVASDMHKPDGLTLIRPEDAASFIDRLPIEKIPGIGKVTAAKMIRLGIKTGGDIKKMKVELLIKRFGKSGEYFYKLVHCLHNSPVVAERKTKSISNETTFFEDLSDENTMLETLSKLSSSVVRRMNRYNISARTITLKIKYFDFVSHTRSRTVSEEFNNEEVLYGTIKDLFYTPSSPEKPIRLLGVGVSNLNDHQSANQYEQLTLNF